MPETLGRTFDQANSDVDASREFGHTYAAVFTMDNTREAVMRVHQFCKQMHTDLTDAQEADGIDAYAAEQWEPGFPNFTAKTDDIKTALQDILTWIQQNMPTVQSTLNAAMAQNPPIPPAQQDSLRQRMGDNLKFVLTHDIESGAIVSPLLPASVLAPLIPLLQALEAAATMP